jgi:hypothetical protein
MVVAGIRLAGREVRRGSLTGDFPAVSRNVKRAKPLYFFFFLLLLS